jgi:mono/diheme cytochrome c family protein
MHLDPARLDRPLTGMMIRPFGPPLLTLAAALLASLALPAHAQDSTHADSTPPAPIYSDGQAKKGEKTYAKHCSACHELFYFTGSRFEETWAGHPAFDLFDRIQSSMPQDRPGSLSKQQYAEVVAYILKLNGYPPGREALPSEPEALKVVMIGTKPKS